MRIIVMFDLPTLTERDRKNYSLFRKQLLQKGYYMLQFSIYVRICNNHEDAKKRVDSLKKILPPGGNVRALVITDKQYTKMLVLLGDELTWEKDHIEPHQVIVI